MMAAWSDNIRKVEPYVPGEQPKDMNVIKPYVLAKTARLSEILLGLTGKADYHVGGKFRVGKRRFYHRNRPSDHIRIVFPTHSFQHVRASALERKMKRR